MTILVPIADGPLTDRVLDVATEMGTRYDRPLYVVHLVSDDSASGEARWFRDTLERELDGSGVDYEVAIEQITHSGPRAGTRIAREIVDLAADVGVDHIVMGHEERGLVRGLTHGSTASAVLDNATVPVTIVPETMT